LQAVKALTLVSLSIGVPSQSEANLFVSTLTDLLKHSDEVLINETVISLQRIINSQEGGKAKDDDSRLKTK
jgi:hypothetical protein